MLSRHFIAAVTAASAIALACAAPTLAEDRPEVRIAVVSLTKHFDPLGENSNVNERVSENVVERLIRYNQKTGEFEPSLATEWHMVDDKTIELTIRDGVKCHDGTDFTARDVEVMFGPKRFSVEGAPAYAGSRSSLGIISSVEAIDAKHVVFKTSDADPMILQRLASGAAGVPCATAFEAAPSWEAWGQHVIGTGPYMIDKVLPDDMHRLVAFDGYWGEKAPASAITYKIVPEAATRIAGLLAGEYDIITEIQPDNFKALEGDPNVAITGGAINSLRVIAFDSRNPILKDARVRRALALAIDRQAIVDAVFDGRTEVPNGHQLKSFGKMYIADHKGATYNPDEAKRLLAEAGYKGEELSYRYRNNYYTGEVATAQILEQMWRAVGLNVKLELVENPDQVNKEEGRAITNLSSGTLFDDPTGQLAMFAVNGSVYRTGLWKNEEFDAAMARTKAASDLTQRQAGAAEMLDIYENDPPATYLHVMPMFYGVSKKLNWAPTGTTLMDFSARSLSFN